MKNDNITICKTIRKHSASTLAKILKEALEANKKISELDFKNNWLRELRKSPGIFSDGWYIPPPNGIGVLFATSKNTERVGPPTLRYEKFWPKKDIYLDKNDGLIFAYCSPVDKKTGVIGDFGISLYLGKDITIIKHIKLCYKIQNDILDYVKINKTFSDIATYAKRVFSKHNLVASLVSSTDPTGTNIGHTIPFTNEAVKPSEKQIIKNGTKDWQAVVNLLSNKRIFVNASESYKVKKRMSFTVEPRPHSKKDNNMPGVFFHSIVSFDIDGKKELVTNFDELFQLCGMDYLINKENQKINYAQSGVDYDSLDPAKKLAQVAAKSTSIHLKKMGFEEVEASRGEAAFVWKQKNIYMASVTESLGTKNLVADAMREITKKTYYDVIGHDTIATALNDLTSVGAKPLVVTAFWAVGKSSWFDDIERIKDLVAGWKSACDIAGATWGGGESPSYNDIVEPHTIALGGSVVGIISSKKRILLDSKLKVGDRIILLKSNGVNANGLSLARVVAKKLPKGYATKLSDGTYYGEALLTKTNIYAELIQNILDAKIELHYISNITGHGLRKIMRARGQFTYVLEKLFEPQEIFRFIQDKAEQTDYELYETYNMGMDYALFLPEKDVKKTLRTIKKAGFEGIDAGYVEKGERQVIIKPKNLVYKGETLNLR